MTRIFRRSVCRALAGMLLFSQLAIAAYACPGMSPVMFPDWNLNYAPAPAAVAAVDGLPGDMSDSANGVVPDCGQMDRITPNLCTEHCHYGQQSADHAPAPALPAVLFTLLYPAPLLPEASSQGWLSAAPENPPSQASPSHAILHCCFRI